MLRSLLGGSRCTALVAHNCIQTISVADLQLSGLQTALSGCHHHLHSNSSSSAPQQGREPDVDELQQQLLSSAVQHVKSLGWSRASLAAAAADLQLSPASVGMFPRGAGQLVEHFIAQQNAELSRELQGAQQQYLELPLRQRIAAAVRRRLELNAPYIDSWPQALYLMSQPANAPAALKLLTELMDTIWYAAGDTATDSTWYTKRAALASIYLSTELYMITDYSPGYADTWQQLERRIDDVLWLGSAVQSAAALPQLVLQALSQLQPQQQPHPQPGQARSAGQGAGTAAAHATAVTGQPAAAATAGEGTESSSSNAGTSHSTGSSSSSSSGPGGVASSNQPKGVAATGVV